MAVQRSTLSWRSGETPRVLVLGGGFAGLAAVRALSGAACNVVLVDRQNHHLFQPLLYQVATAGLSGSDIAQPLRSILADQANAQVHRATVTRIDLSAGVVYFAEDPRPLDFDYLVLALGMVTNWFGKPEWAQHAMGLKSLHDAYRIRDRMLHAAELAENEFDDEAKRATLLTTVVVGGGPTGVEMAGALAELGRREIEAEFRVVRANQLRVVLVSADERPLSTFDPKLSRRTLEDLRALGVEVRLGTMVRGLEPASGGTSPDDPAEGTTDVRLDGETIRAHTVVWAAGVRAPALIAGLGVPTDRAGRVVVEPDCSVPGHPNVFAVGDVAAMRHGAGFVPGVAQGAMQSGAFVGRLIRDRVTQPGGAATRRARPAFTYRDRGSMATIGRARAVAEIGKLRLGGTAAWLLWLFIHVMFLVDLRSRSTVLLKWIWAYVFFRPSNRVVAAEPTELPVGSPT